MPEVKIGDRAVAVNDFNGRKYFRAGKLLGSLMRSGPELWVAAWQAQEQARQEATVRLSRAEYSMTISDPQERERFDAVSEDAWAASGQVLEVVRDHDATPRVIMAVFPLAMERQPETVAELLALAVAEEEPLGEAARKGQMDSYLEERAHDLLDEARGPQLVELAVVVAEVAQEEIQAKLGELGKRVGKLRRLFGIPERPAAETPEPTPTPAEPPAPEPPPPPVPVPTANGSNGRHETAPDGASREPSSIGSQPRTAGPPTSSSIESPGGSSPSSTTG